MQTLEAKRKPVPLNPALRAQRDGARDPLGKQSEAWARRVTQGPWGGGRAGKSRTGPYRITGLATASGLRVSHLRGNLPMQPRWKRFGMALGGAGAGGCFFHRLVLNILDFLEIARRESEAPSGPSARVSSRSPLQRGVARVLARHGCESGPLRGGPETASRGLSGAPRSSAQHILPQKRQRARD